MDVIGYTVEAYNFLLELVRLVLAELLQPAPLLALLAVIGGLGAIPLFYIYRQRRHSRPHSAIHRHEPSLPHLDTFPVRQRRKSWDSDPASGTEDGDADPD